MDKITLHLYLSRILSGFYVFLFNDKKYKLIYPNIDIKYQSEIYASNCYDNNKFNDWITDEDIVNYLVDMGMWHYGGDDQLTKIETQIDDYKVQLYENFLNPPKQKQIRKSLESLKKTHTRLYNIRHSFDHLTSQGYADLLKNQYILINSIYTIDDKKIFRNTKNINFQKLNEMSNIITESNIDISTFRSIARNDSWKSYWSANKEHIFDKSVINWTDEQRTLVVLTKMYDSAYEHPECPLDAVFNDDDMFDGWMIQQRRESEKNKNQNRTEKMLEGKNLSKANEVYIMASSKEEAQSIYSLNDNSSKNIIKERTVAINRHQELKESELPDVQRSIQVQQNQNFMDSRKGK